MTVQPPAVNCAAAVAASPGTVELFNTISGSPFGTELDELECGAVGEGEPEWDGDRDGETEDDEDLEGCGVVVPADAPVFLG